MNKANFGKLAAGKTQGVEWTVESKQPQGGESLIASSRARLQSNLAAALSSEKAHLQAIRHHWLPSFPAIEP